MFQLVLLDVVFCNEKDERDVPLFLNYKLSSTIRKMCDKWVNLTSLHHNQLKEKYQHFHLLDLNRK